MNTLPGQNGVLLLAVAGLLAACNPSTPETSSTHTDTGMLLLDQNWTDADREFSWFTTFGSRVLPETWFKALERANEASPFASEENLSRFGFAFAGASEANPNNFPIGITVTPQRDGHAWVGLGCSACHSGQVYYQNQQIHIDGGQAMLEFQLFEQSVIDALNATLRDDEKFRRFARAVGEAEPVLKEQVSQWTQSLIKRQHINRTDSHYGRGRLDAFGQIFNAVTVSFLGIEENRRDPDAPVSYPVLWDAPHMDLVQWNASAPNAGPGPLIQNATTALAVFGDLDIHHNDHGLGYKSSIEISNLGPIQDRWYKLTSPQWPTQVLGALNTDLVAQGKTLYADNCLACHALSDRNDPDRMIKATKVSLDQVGTDPTMVDNFLGNQAQTGDFEGRKLLFAAGPEFGATAPAIKLVAHATIGALLDHPLAATMQGVLSAHKVKDAPIDDDPRYYKARPLSGIWASAPYLHNGSVPTLAEMLSPEKRRNQFAVGKVEFDPVNVGLSDEVLAADQVSDFDTRLPGNSNAGHLFGTHLSPDEKAALIEYLKSL